MQRYKEDYYIYKQKDINGNYTSNKDDNFIKCKNNIIIYRYNPDTLIVQFSSNGIANNRIKELSELGVKLIPFQIGDDERTYKFNEADFPIISNVVKAKKRIKRELTDEKRKELSDRMKKLHSQNDVI